MDLAKERQAASAHTNHLASLKAAYSQYTPLIKAAISRIQPRHEKDELGTLAVGMLPPSHARARRTPAPAPCPPHPILPPSLPTLASPRSFYSHPLRPACLRSHHPVVNTSSRRHPSPVWFNRPPAAGVLQDGGRDLHARTGLCRRQESDQRRAPLLSQNQRAPLPLPSALEVVRARLRHAPSHHRVRLSPMMSERPRRSTNPTRTPTHADAMCSAREWAQDFDCTSLIEGCTMLLGVADANMPKPAGGSAAAGPSSAGAVAADASGQGSAADCSRIEELK